MVGITEEGINKDMRERGKRGGQNRRSEIESVKKREGTRVRGREGDGRGRSIVESLIDNERR